MSIRSAVRSFTIVVISLASASAAFARNPPALVRSQQSQGHDTAASGYRDALARFGAHAHDAEPGRTATGYRDSLTRFAQRTTPVRVASNR